MASHISDIKLPAPLAQLPSYVDRNPELPISDVIDPYIKYEARLRQLYAQSPNHELVREPHANVLPLFGSDTPSIKARARDLDSESREEQEKYIMALPEDKRRPTGSPAVVENLREFRDNFAVFSESSLADLDWSNVVAAGSSVVNCLLPIPQEFKSCKKTLRQYFHEKFCPASDIDLFLYGLTEEEAIDKIKHIETCIRDSILTDITSVRTKNVITICSQYPTRHVQIVLRIYKNVSEILTGFDVDCSGAAYDGKKVYVTPRALASYITQVNHIDLTRRSPSYENRLSKYSRRNFEVYWPELERSRLDPTIFERSFKRTRGLARLLVLEQLPTPNARGSYREARMKVRGRPVDHRGHKQPGLRGNIKQVHDDEVADWIAEDEASSYHTFTLPYGQKYHARKIEKILYTRDLLLNAEWNKPSDRTVNLHRHPAFFGHVEDIINDCCCNCPDPRTEKEIKTAEEESKMYISGKISFMKDNPGRQNIGSFNPLTDEDWTEMAYISNTERLCRAIVDSDIDAVKQWLSRDGGDLNRRDCTGRTPLHLAVMTSTKQVVQCLVDHGARLVARLTDGRTALHLAAQRGDGDLVKILLDRSIANEEVEKARKAKSRETKFGTTKNQAEDEDTDAQTDLDHSSAGSDGYLIDANDSDTDDHSVATGSFVKVKATKTAESDVVPEEDEDDPDYYDVDVLSWDLSLSALHLAILCGHSSIVKLLCNEYGADQNRPATTVSSTGSFPTQAILPLALALTLPKENAKEMVDTLISVGASCSQADTSNVTAFHRFVRFGCAELVLNFLEKDRISAKAALNHLLVESAHFWVRCIPTNPLISAIQTGDAIMVLKLLEAGAEPEIKFESWFNAMKGSSNPGYLQIDTAHAQETFSIGVIQPLIAAVCSKNPDLAIEIANKGADVNSLLDKERVMGIFPQKGVRSVLEIVRERINALKSYKAPALIAKPVRKHGMDAVLKRFPEDSYQHWLVSCDIEATQKAEKYNANEYEKQVKPAPEQLEREKGEEIARREKILKLEKVEVLLLSKGAKTYLELHPDGKREALVEEGQNQAIEETPVQYNFEFKFNAQNVTETRNQAYMKLFEACWSGELETIKTLTLKPWGKGDHQEPPLEIGTTDGMGNSPFSLAFSRGYYAIARAVLDIVAAQFSPKEKKEIRYTMMEDHSYDSSSSYEHRFDGPPRLQERNVCDKNLTTHNIAHNIAEASMTVKGRTKPLDLLEQPFPLIQFKNGKPKPSNSTQIVTPISYCIALNDPKALEFILDTGIEFAARELHRNNESDDMAPRFTVSQNDYKYAISSGHTELLAALMRKAGAGMPLEKLVKNSGVEMRTKPKYYQGLTVYGKKRADWANAGRTFMFPLSEDKIPPFLQAALLGSIESLEWCRGDGPARNYLEWCQSKSARHDPRLKHLRESGLHDTTLENWLGADRDYLLHCAVTASTGDKNELIKHIIKMYPGILEVRTKNGYTPLCLAFRRGLYQCAKILIEAGADQAVKTKNQENLIHLLVDVRAESKFFREMLELLNPDLRDELMSQRNNLSVGGLTPIHKWVSGVLYSEEISSDMFKVLLEFKSGNGKELSMLNSAGNTIMHTLVMKDVPWLVTILAEFDSSLLYRENAVGRTPIEIAEDAYIHQQLQKGELYGINSMNYQLPDWELPKGPRKVFVAYPKDLTGPEQRLRVGTTNCDKLWHAVRRCQAKYPVSPRHLVSLHEATEAVHHLSNEYVDQRWTSTASWHFDKSHRDAADEKESMGCGEDFMYGYNAWFPQITLEGCGTSDGGAKDGVSGETE